MSLHASGLRLRLSAVSLGRSALPSAKPAHLGLWLTRPHSTIPRAPWHLRPTPAVGELLPSYGASRRSQLGRPVGPTRSLASSQPDDTHSDAASSFSAMTVVSQRVDGVRWRVFGAIPDHVGIPGTKKLRKKLSGPSVMSWYPSTLEELHVPLYREKGQLWTVRRKRRREARGKFQTRKGQGKRASLKKKK